MSSSSFTPQSKYTLQQPAWSRDAVIYQINTRQYSLTGNFEAVTADLPRIKALGADIIWLMPIHPIGEKNRKGSLGSPYAVKDYYGINPEFGSEADFHALVKAAHSLNMKVILDWVPNHSAWDCNLVSEHPDWYARDFKGDFRPSPWWDWDDIIEFDYDNSALREYMVEAMSYWVKRFDIDGFRCDVAGYVPNDFWSQLRAALDNIKPVFMLAEWENRDLHEDAFNMTYAWSWHETLTGIAQGTLPLDKLRKYYSWNERAWPASAYRMTFATNHDMNAWDGTQEELFGNLLKAIIVLSVIGEGMPLVHNGQEAGDTKQLAFFERDPIDWAPHEIGELYSNLIAIKKRISALHNGPFGATMIQLPNSKMDQIFSFTRAQGSDKVVVILNLSHQPAVFSINSPLWPGHYTDLMTGKPFTADAATELTLGTGEFRLLEYKAADHQ